MGAFPDKRRGKNRSYRSYRMVEAALGAFSVFWMQRSSFLEHQRAMEQAHRRRNANTIFGLQRIPTDNPIRCLLDGIDPHPAYPALERVFEQLHPRGHRAPWRRLDGQLLIALDGTQYHHSNALHCEQCLVSERAGVVRYSHTLVTPVVVAPGQRRVIARAPEFVVPQDGHHQQDGETAGSKRWLAVYGVRCAAGGDSGGCTALERPLPPCPLD